MSTARLSEQKIEKEKLSDKVSKRIREMIVSGELKSGDRIVETRIAKLLGTSQAPVREALRELETMGLVEIRPYNGCYVVPINKEKLLEIYDLRTMVECYAAVHGAPKLTEENIAAMARYLDELAKAEAAGDVEGTVKYDVAFHREIVRAADNPTLMRMWEMTGAEQWSSVTISSRIRSNYLYFAKSHVRMLQLIREKKFEELPAEIERHFRAAMQFVMESGLVERQETESAPAVPQVSDMTASAVS